MADVFISYRRDDSAYALLLYDRLGSDFGRDRVFRDVDDIRPGQYFDEVIRAELNACRAMVAVIGPGWVRARERLQDDHDWVRREIALALGRPMLVVPVLVGGVQVPVELPVDVAEITRAEAVTLTDARFHRDETDLVDALATVVSRRPADVALPEPDARQRVAAEMLRRQVARLQMRAVELIQEGKVDRAQEELAEGSELLMLLMDWSPAEVDLQVQLGYLYKTIAQAFDAAGDREQAERYLDLAASAFEDLRQHAASKTGLTTADLASVINGLGNVYAERGQLDRAIELYRAAVEMIPTYAYAWHDLFGALDGKARRGEVNVPAMREALAKVKATGAGQPGLSAEYLAGLEARLATWERS